MKAINLELIEEESRQTKIADFRPESPNCTVP